MSTGVQKPKPKALFFDASLPLHSSPFPHSCLFPYLTAHQIFGTVVDWRTTVTNYLHAKSFETLNSPATSISMPTRLACAHVSWPDFAQEWRQSYYDFTRSQAAALSAPTPVDTPPPAFKSVDEHHHSSLRILLVKHGLTNLWTADEVHEISLIWHRLDAWPDSSRGLTSLQTIGFTLSTLSNGNTSLLTDLASHASLPFHNIISAEQFRAYKPHPSVYNGACKQLGLDPGECAMVAAHLGDLEAAREVGMQTIYVEREGEEAWGVEKVREARRKGWVDMWVDRDEDFVGGGLLEVMRRFEVGSLD
ncbi:hypothetical protein JMJ35_002706 [Cladonia borealis]|uniref:Haloacid dehalogenase n=1 Tax=Cladonia borealis TaxID=184061 RepID=A0AA39R5L9_9LECA|nr:hypothetical protein JMJ35_002706 [Cladonia borealis]